MLKKLELPEMDISGLIHISSIVTFVKKLQAVKNRGDQW